MAAQEIKLSDDIEAEFNPLVVILANDANRYGSFAKAIGNAGLSCEVHTNPSAIHFKSPRAGTIFYVSFNLKSADPTALARSIEHEHGMTCIVFAEQEGFETAAKLSSAKMTQTLQYPYTEKNFLMGVQTIINKRKVVHAKNQRKNTVLERRKSLTEAPVAEVTGPDTRRFKAETKAQALNAPVIIQKGPRLLTGVMSAVERRALAQAFSEVQKGLPGVKFFVIQSGPENLLGNHQPGSLSETLELKQSPSHESSSSGSEMKEGDKQERLFPSLSHQPSAQDMATSIARESAASHENAEKKSTEVFATETSHTANSALASAVSRFFAQGRALVGYGKRRLRARDLFALNLSEKKAKAERPQENQAAALEAKLSFDHGAQPSPFKEVTKISESLVVPTWFVIAILAIGIVFCLCFLYLMIR